MRTAMRSVFNALLSLAAIIYTVFYMSLNELTTNEGALSKTGLKHPVLFFIWGILIYISLYTNIFMLAKCFGKIRQYHYITAVSALIGMAFTLIFKFDYSLRFQYFMHCAGSLVFSVCTGIAVFFTYLSGFRIKAFNAVLTIMIGIILIADLILLLIFKQNALIEGVPVILALAAMPVTVMINNIQKDEKVLTNAAR